MSESKMQELANFGQSVWLDYIDRPLLETGKLKGLIDQGLRGMTSNPSIFNNAIGASNDYDEKISELAKQGKSTFEIYDALTIQDIQEACDQFKDVYAETDRLDGYVSLEINPQIANDTQAQIDEGKRLFEIVARPNVMIKVPATDAGIPVVEELIASGINVNVTLIFSVEQYVKVVNAYFTGLNRLAETTDDLSHVRSVASVFVSRIDATVDSMIDDIYENSTEEDKETLNGLRGRAAVANSHLVFEKWAELLLGDNVKSLENKNANMQRVLWASTGTKNPDYSDIKYVTELISNPSVNTLPEKTLNAFCDHGTVDNAFVYPASDSQKVIDELKKFNIDVNAICQQLLDKGVVAFDDAFVDLFASIEKKAKELVA